MAGRRPTLAVLAAGLLVIVAARLALPAAPPLYDGVVPIGPYLWLDPPPGQRGGAQGTTAGIPRPNGQSPLVAVATPESVPQAQVFAQPDSLTVPPGARGIKVAITPVHPDVAPASGHIDSNVYRISVTDDSGTPLTAPASAGVSVVLRVSDPPRADATIARFSGGSWQPLKTSSAGFGGTLIAVVTEFGDFAVIAPGAAATATATQGAAPSAGSSPPVSVPPAADVPGGPGWLVPGLGVIGIGLLLGAGALWRGRPKRYRGAHPVRRR